MNTGFLLDTNTVIDYFGDRLSVTSNEVIEQSAPNISVITRIELLAWPNASLDQIAVMRSFIDCARVFLLEESVIEKTIHIRKTYKLKLPDAIIAATAIANNLTLVTHNLSDFGSVKELTVVNSR